MTDTTTTQPNTTHRPMQATPEPSRLPRIILFLITTAVVLAGLLWIDTLLMQFRFWWIGDGPPDDMLRQFNIAFRITGEFPFSLILMLGVACVDLRRRWLIVVAVIIAQILAAAAVNPVKLTVARYRPWEAREQLGPLSEMTMSETWLGLAPLNKDHGRQSFPSGHSSAAVATCALMGWFFPQLRWIFYSLGAAGCLSRYIDAVHWMSDSWMGGMLGLAAAWIAWQITAKWRRQLATSEEQ
jgi:membrane-associated phospholipid phosphatase